jgi:hypothetical protein
MSTESQSLTVLCDFARAYRAFEWRTVGVPDWIRNDVVEPLHRALEEALPRVTIRSAAEIRHAIRQCTGLNDHYRVTVDGQSYFRGHVDFDLTRIAPSRGELLRGPYERGLRHSDSSVYLRGNRVVAQYRSTGGDRPIAVCDDGISTGRSMKEVVINLKDHGVTPALIVVLVNPRSIKQIEGVKVINLFDCEAHSAWLNERDLYWGLPRSGVSMRGAREDSHNIGVPYSLAVELLTSRIGISPDAAASLRPKILEVNQIFWQRLEEAYGQKLCLRDSLRLQGLTERLDFDDGRIVGIIREVAQETYALPLEKRHAMP